LAALHAASLAAQPHAAASRPALAISRVTPHLTFTAALSPTVIEPGTRMSIVVDVVPKKGIHVYAPGTKYRPIAIALRPDALLRIDAPVYPKPTPYIFKPLNEEVLVYDAPFRLALDVIAGSADAQRARWRRGSELAIKGTLEYQACNDTVCYLPVSVPVQWTVRVKPAS
jgi:hypothetical protein